MTTLQPCGTNAAYQRHIDRGEATCEPCRKAHNERPSQARGRRIYNAAAGIARRALREAHPDEYRALLADERAQDPVATYTTAYGRAERQLIKRHPTEYRAIFNAEHMRLLREAQPATA